MPNTLATLLHRSLDFAGLFPPAAMAVPESLAIFRREQGATRAEMLARFVCPLLRLEELVTAGADADSPLHLSVLPRGGRNAGEFLANLETDLAAIRRLALLHDGGVVIDTIELRPPADAMDVGALRKLIAAIDALLVRHAANIRQVFLELAPTVSLAGQLALLAEETPRSGGAESPSFGYKLRTGGSDTATAPSAAQIASTLASVASLGLPMKCTGGLHHPLRANSAGPAASTHGFINLLVAAALAAGAPTPGTEILEAVLEESSPAAFTFDQRSLAWRDHQVDTVTVAASRQRLLVSFGSCYAEQPRTELQRLGWWPKTPRAQSARLPN